MAEIKDKVITLESLKALHDYNKDEYMSSTDPTGTGALSLNRTIGTIVGSQSVALGTYNTASGNQSIALGAYNTASGTRSVALGFNNDASGYASMATGQKTIANGDEQYAQGRFNLADNENKYAHIIGNGYMHENGTEYRSNAYTLDWDGNAWYAGDITAEGNMILTASQYGDELPEAGTMGRIFFKKLSE